MTLRGGARRERIEPGPGQESVWDYPRPPRFELSQRRVLVRSTDTLIAATSLAYRILETSHPPNWYLPPDGIRMDLLRPSRTRGTVCEWKGLAKYWDVVTDSGVLPDAAWSYPAPTAGYTPLADYLAFYPSQLQCFVDEEAVRPQEGAFYGGWITEEIVGPFKGAPGTWGW